MGLLELAEMVPEEEWVHIDPMSIPLSLIMPLNTACMVKSVGYLDVVKVPCFIANSFHLKVLDTDPNFCYQMKMFA
jgi:hypothetical protein